MCQISRRSDNLRTKYQLLSFVDFTESVTDKHTYKQQEAKDDVLSNINRVQAAERAEKCRFCPW